MTPQDFKEVIFHILSAATDGRASVLPFSFGLHIYSRRIIEYA